MNNGVMERMKAATHTLVAMEIERSTNIRDTEAYRRARLPEIMAEHAFEWRMAYTQNPKITVSQFVSMVTGQRVEAQRIAKGAMESNMDRMRALAAEPIDVERNLAGIAAARQALHRG